MKPRFKPGRMVPPRRSMRTCFMQSLRRPECGSPALLEPGFWGGRLYHPLSAPWKVALESAKVKSMRASGNIPYSVLHLPKTHDGCRRIYYLIENSAFHFTAQTSEVTAVRLLPRLTGGGGEGAWTPRPDALSRCLIHML